MKLRYLFFAAAVSTLAAACSEVDELASSSSQKTLETIQSGTDNFTTRVNLDSQWEAGDAIGVYMLDAGTGNIRNSAMNIQYNAEVTTTSTTTDFVAANGGIGIFDQPCDFKAYYPYSSNEDGKVDMGAGLYNIDLLSGTLSEGSTPKSVSLYRTDEKNVFMGIMLPTTELRNKMKLSITTTDGKKYQYTVPDGSSVDKFVGGCKYEYTINVESDDSSLEGGDGGNKPWQPGGEESGDGDEVLDNDDIPEDYTQVKVASNANLAELLNSNKENERIALIFPEGEYISGKITVPAEVKELLFISETKTQSKLTLTGGVVLNDKTLENLEFNNLEITGSEVRLIEREGVFAEGGVFAIKNCKIHNIKDVLSFESNPEETLTSFAIENCYIGNISSLLYNYRVGDVTIANSTLYNMGITVKNGASKVDIHDCTLVGLTATAVENSDSWKLNNSIVACFAASNMDNFAYNAGTLLECTGNYAAKSENPDLLPMIKNHKKDIDKAQFPNAWKELEKTQAELFDGTNEEGEFYTTITDAGDPRWRQGAQ